jgi:hypothetical protein
MGLAAIAAAGAAAANLFCAALYGAVFLSFPRSAHWTSFEASPVGFVMSVLLSLVAAPALALMGIVAVKGARDERRFLERLYTATPRYEDEYRRGAKTGSGRPPQPLPPP